ncbi:hypothetical protein GYMLUDRAFT_42406 [Collybiopsis luxurians FD-317 M1]|uniref:Chromo domain-containing protein n=1 Tax=Collybiopsis luxurians FD-317 M1 TaxID=944289 RepID=A0A0D0CZK0_9AGAR|nr:hypothetical protein GYMLUDRAFT_42406 [Collybiopsis luxurians FD-317 M1]
MARADSVVADSEGKPEDVNALEDDAMKSVELNGQDAENGAEDEEGGSEEEEEYEIEEIIKHQKGYFPAGRMGYLVKWKNYGQEHNSWVDEQDAGNADELIANYWTKKNKKPESTSARKGRKSIANESPEPSSRKRRKSTTKDDDEEDESVSVKKKRMSTTNTKKKAESVDPESEDNDAGDKGKADETVYGENHMQRFMKQTTWEKLIARVDTVEKPSDNDQLIVYFRLKKDNRRVRLPAKICNEKFPQAMLSFYESNLKWKETEVDDASTTS